MRQRLRSYLRIAAASSLLALGGLGLIACGGDGDDGATEVSMTEYAFEPKDLTVSKGDEVTVKNDGQIGHNYSVLGGGDRRCRARTGYVRGELDQPLAWRIARCREGGSGAGSAETIAPGRDGSFPVDFTRSRYDVICTIPGHAEKGMRGTLTVE